MPSIKIPTSALPAVQNLIRLDQKDFETFLEALSKAPPSLEPEKFWTHVIPYINNVKPTIVKSIIKEIFVMDATKDEMGVKIEEFANAIANACEDHKSKEFPFNEADKVILADRVQKIFQGRKGLKITTKALGIAVDQQNVFYSAKILTDIRPVFDDTGESVDAALVIHNLRIHYGKDSEHLDFYVALDVGDIQLLREVLDRAEIKAKSLQDLLKKSNISYLDAEE